MNRQDFPYVNPEMNNISISSIVRAILEIGPNIEADVDAAHSGIASDLKPLLCTAYQIVLKFGELENVSNLSEDLINERLPEILKLLASNKITSLGQFLHFCKFMKSDIVKIQILLISYVKTKNQPDYIGVNFPKLHYVVDDKVGDKKNEIISQAELICKIVSELINEREKIPENCTEMPFTITEKHSHYLIDFAKYNTKIQVFKVVIGLPHFT